MSNDLFPNVDFPVVDLIPVSNEQEQETDRPVIGREAQIDILNGYLLPHITNERQSAQIINISGLPGIGKSSLAQRWMDDINAHGDAHTVVLTEEDIINAYFEGGHDPLVSLLSRTVDGSRANVIQLPSMTNYSTAEMLRQIEIFMCQHKDEGGDRARVSNRTMIVVESIDPLRFEDHWYARLYTKELNLGPFGLTEVEQLVDDPAKAKLVYALTGGYPPAVWHMRKLSYEMLDSAVNLPGWTNNAQYISALLLKTLEEEKILDLLTDTVYTNSEASRFENPEIVARKLLYAMAKSEQPLHHPQTSQVLGMKSSSSGLYAMTLVSRLVDWKDAEKGVHHAGYVLKEPIKTMLAYIYSVYESTLAFEAMEGKQQAATRNRRGKGR